MIELNGKRKNIICVNFFYNKNNLDFKIIRIIILFFIYKLKKNFNRN